MPYHAANAACEMGRLCRGQIVRVVFTCLQLYEHVCDERKCTDIGCQDPDVPATVLLLPPDFQLLPDVQLPELVKLLSVGELRGSSLGGLTFGSEIPEYKGRGRRVSYPSGPTWQVHPSLHPRTVHCNLIDASRHNFLGRMSSSLFLLPSWS